MIAIPRLLAACLGLAALAAGQTPLFQALDSPVPQSGGSLRSVGDLDGDGDVDLHAQFSFLLNDGHARFSTAAAATPPWTINSPTLADLNGDGLLDIVSVSTTGQGVGVYLNAGGLVFTPVAGLPAVPAAHSAINFAVADVDGDGDADVLIGTTQFVTPHHVGSAPPILWLNNGAGSFTVAPATSLPLISLPPQQMLFRDLDNDGDPDGVFANSSQFWNSISVAVLMNSGGTFAQAPLPGGPFGDGAIELGEFNGDGFPDLVFVQNFSSVSVFLGSAGGFLPPVVSPVLGFQIAALDVNGDGKDELLVFSWLTGASLYSVTTSGTIGPPLQTWPSILSPMSWLGPGSRWVRDLDGDQDRDVVVWSSSETALLMNDGAGSLVLTGGHTVHNGLTWGHRVADLDADGDQDVLGMPIPSLYPPSAITTALNDGDGWFSPGPTSNVPGLFTQAVTSYSVHPFDRDGDGDADVYCAYLGSASSGGPTDSVYDNAGNGSLTLFAPVQTTGLTALFESADFDGDGDQDVVLGKRGPSSIANAVTGPMAYLANQGSTGMGPPVLIGNNHATYDLDLGDFDGNGTVDVFQSNFVPSGAPDFCVAYLNAGNGTFTSVIQTFSGQLTAAGDFNGDAMTDLVVDGQVWFSGGAGAFFAGPVLPSALLALPVLADVDLDGDLDLVETPGTVMFNGGNGVFGAPVSYLPRVTAPPTWYWLDIPTSTLTDLDRDGDPDIAYSGVVSMNTTRQLARASIPRPGRPGSVDLYGTPGGAWFLFGSTGTTSFPYPPWGNVLIDPASAQLGAMGLFAAAGPTAGTASFGVTLPNNPAIVGSTTYWQAIDAVQMRFTNRLTVTVMGY
jgi:FG-GAP-like repeat